MDLLNPLSIARSIELFPGKSFKATCPPSLAVGYCVYIAGPKVDEYYQVDRADPSNIVKMPALGVVTEKTDSTHCVVQCLGELQGLFTGLTFPKSLFVTMDGRLSHDLPMPAPAPDSYAMVQPMGTAMGSSEVLLSPNFLMIKRIE
jgi:hypothetical protein